MSQHNGKAEKALTIAFINSTRKWGGVKSWTLDFGEALSLRGHKIISIVRPETPFVDACVQRGFEVFTVKFGPKYNPLAIARIARILKTQKADISIVNISKDINIGATASKLCGLPVIHRVGLIEDFKGSFEERLSHNFLVDRIIVPSLYMRHGLTAKFNWIRHDKITAIHNSKKLNLFKKNAARGAERFVFGVTSQLSAGKGHELLFKAAAELKNKGLQFELRVAGVGLLEGSLKELAGKLDLDDMVVFCGFQNNIPGFLAELDAFVLPSLKEGFPNSALEAMCAGLPVISFETGSMAEMLGDSGIVLPEADCRALSGAMERMLLDDRLCSDLSKTARQRAESSFDVDKNAIELEKLFLSTISA